MLEQGDALDPPGHGHARLAQGCDRIKIDRADARVVISDGVIDAWARNRG